MVSYFTPRADVCFATELERDRFKLIRLIRNRGTPTNTFARLIDHNCDNIKYKTLFGMIAEYSIIKSFVFLTRKVVIIIPNASKNNPNIRRWFDTRHEVV